MFLRKNYPDDFLVIFLIDFLPIRNSLCLQIFGVVRLVLFFIFLFSLVKLPVRSGTSDAFVLLAEYYNLISPYIKEKSATCTHVVITYHGFRTFAVLSVILHV